MDWNVWGPPLAVLVVGLGAGAGLVFKGRERFAHDPTRDDLEARREVLMAQLRDLDGDKGKLDEATWNARREALLADAASVLRQLEEGSDGEAATTPPAETETPPEAAGNRHLGWYAVGLIAFLLVAGVALSTGLSPRQEGATMTGNVQSVNAAANDAEAAFAEDPDNIDLCNRATKTAIYGGDLQAAMRNQDACRALDPEHPVVAAHTAALHIVISRFDDAGTFLTPHLGDDAPLEVVLWQGIVDLNTGNVMGGLDKLQTVADNSDDPLDADFARFVIADVKSSMAGASAPPADQPTSSEGPADGPVAAGGITGSITGEVSSGGVLFVYVKAAAVDAGPPMGALKIADWSLPMDFQMTEANLLPFAGGVFPDPAYVKVKVVRSGDPMQKSPDDVESEWVEWSGEPLSLRLGG